MSVEIETIDGELELLPDDIALIVRDGHIRLKSNSHEVGESVPEDFIVFMGFATLFYVDAFRERMMEVVHENKKTGLYTGILGDGRRH